MARTAQRRIGKQSAARVTAIVVAGALGAMLLGLGLLVRTTHDDAADALDERFQTRAALTARFARAYLDDFAERERLQAERLLSDESVDQATFEQVVASFGIEAAVLLDNQGRLLHVWPSRPEIIGRDMTLEYAHLRTAVDGKVGVSEMVPSAARRVPITAVAVPFETSSGRRVFSGAFSPEATPLGAYLDSAVPVEGGGGYLVDASGDTLAGHRGDGAIDASELQEGLHLVDGPDGSTTAAVADVLDAPWRVVLTAPTGPLHAPLNGAGSSTSFALLAALAVCGLATALLVLRLAEARARATELAETDALTGLANRRAIEGVLERAIAHSGRHHEPMAVLLVDLDRFKMINDTHGHDTGDAVLRAAAAVLRHATRAEDAPGRWGGEEFVVVVPGTGAAQAITVAERIRCAISDMAPPSLTGADRITASIGVAVLAGPDDDAAGLLARADDALYRAKEQGRDRVVLASSTRFDALEALTGTLVSAGR